MIRQPIISVMGHVDHGKTTLLDRIRNSTIAAKEAGGITQHIGASEVPIDVVNKICGNLLKSFGVKITIPGLLFIDTPGHEVFTNLRKRGGSIADIAILVVDVTKGFEPQTVEAVNILKEYKTPFIVAANKVDLITGWHNTKLSSIQQALEKQSDYVEAELQNRIYDLIGRLSGLGLNSELYTNVTSFQKEIAIVPLSAKTGEGIAELLMLITGLSQKFLEEKLSIEVNGPAKGTILEKSELKGLGMTVDVILYDGSLATNDIVAFATPNGVSTAKVKALLKPKPLQQIGDSNQYVYVDKVSAATGVKIGGNGFDEAMPGSPIMQVVGTDYGKVISSEIGDIFKVDPVGIVLKADSIGSIEAISKLLGAEGIKISKKGVGNVTKRDIADAFAMYSSDPLSVAVLAFNVKVDSEADEASRISNVPIVSSNIIYKLIEDYKAFIDSRKRDIERKVSERITMPAQIEVLPNSCFRASHPAIFGVSIIGGKLKAGYRLMNQSGIVVGRVKEMQNEGTPIEVAQKGESVAISMDDVTFGRQIRENQMLYTDISDSEAEMLKGEYANLLNSEELALLEKILSIKRNSKGSLV
ncbi:MAG: translation initiation factor IF-2 [Candidatus Micrarchaeia archaeon]